MLDLLQKTSRGLRMALVLGALGALWGSACASDDSEGSSGGKGGRSGSGGKGAFDAGADRATGGAAGSFGTGGSGATATGGTGGAVDSGCVPHTGAPALDPTMFDPCPDCPGAHCVPNSLVPPEQVAQLGECDAMRKCVPDHFIETLGKFIVDSCRSLNDAEGRCLSVCIPQVSVQKDRLPKDTCGENELCAPCYDPTTGALTGACSAGCDTGPKEPAKTFDECCGGIGSCVPKSLVTTAQLELLGADTCTDPNTICAPNDLAVPTFKPPVCRSLANAEGRCMPDCLPAVASQKDRLPKENCADHHLCAPCYDPLTGALTGACGQNDDAPTEPPVVFDKCCGDLGACVPRSAVPANQQSQLGKDTCAGADDLCAPSELTDPKTMPTTCRSLEDSEGRCLPKCMPVIDKQKDRIPQSTCPATHLCAPCYDPITGLTTGACDQNRDTPTEPPKTFPKCCGTIGACVPTSLIPDAQEPMLGKDVCTGANRLCVPGELSDTAFIPATCSSLGAAEGRCLPACLPSVAAKASSLPRATCPQTHLCAPCFDPTTGTDTDACRVNGDTPKNPPYTFPKCCDYQGTKRGTCVPKSAAPPAAQSLPQDTCADTTWACIPNQKVADQTFKFPSCTSPGPFFFAGACVPECIVNVSDRGTMAQHTCAAGELCAFCVHPITQVRTGACD